MTSEITEIDFNYKKYTDENLNKFEDEFKKFSNENYKILFFSFILILVVSL